MDRGLAVVLTALVGGLVALQAPINAGLGKAVGSLQGAMVSFLIGTTLLVLLVALATGDRFSTLGAVRDLDAHYLLGGVLGAAYVTTVLITVKVLGAGGLTAATIAGQLTASVAVDHFGWLGVAKSPVTATKVLGVVLLAIGVLLVVRD